jgi:hypothetical protein
MFVSDGATIDLEDLNGAAKTDDSLTSNNVGHKLLQVSTFESDLSSSLTKNPNKLDQGILKGEVSLYC